MGSLTKQRTLTILSIISCAAVFLVIEASAQRAQWPSPSPEGQADPGSYQPSYDPLWCKIANCCQVPFIYLLSLPVDSPITNETQLFQSVPQARYVAKFNRGTDYFTRWDGSTCCDATGTCVGGSNPGTPCPLGNECSGGFCQDPFTALKWGTPTNCHPAGPGGCFFVFPGEGYAVVQASPTTYDILGNDGSTTIQLLSPGAGVSRSGTNLISLPYFSPPATALALMQSIGFSSVNNVKKYLCATDTVQVYTGRMGSPGANFNLDRAEAYFVQMNTSVAYTTQVSTSTPSGCASCGPDGTPCGDGSAFCTENDQCAGGTCVGGTFANCDDQNQCTRDSCNGCNGVCVNQLPPSPGTSCDDGNACSTGDSCNASGSCVGGASANCDDGDACTFDECNPGTGCINHTDCDDGNACTYSDGCTGGTCEGTPITCANDQCNTRTCNGTSSCTVTPRPAGTACDDGDACTQTDTCQGGACVGGPPPPELCNGMDDNCSGDVDEPPPPGNPRPPWNDPCGTGSPGACAPGHLTCVSGSLLCVPDQPARPEVCNGIDDNCNGVVDEAEDSDGDGFNNCVDNCPSVPNDQTNTDGDAFGDRCDCAINNPANPQAPEVASYFDPPGRKDSLRIVKDGPEPRRARISWITSPPSGRFRLYRGYKNLLEAWAYNHYCTGVSVAASPVFDPRLSGETPINPGRGTFFYYLVTREGCTESIPGTMGTGGVGEGADGGCSGDQSRPCTTDEDCTGAGTCLVIPNDLACPLPAQDLDDDGVDDLLDNCRDGFDGYNPVQQPEGTQPDPDGDGIGWTDVNGPHCDNCPCNNNPGQENNDSDPFDPTTGVVVCDLPPAPPPTGETGGDECDTDDDNDGILEDGGGNGTNGDQPCCNGAIAGCDDNCPVDQNSDQEDVNNNCIGDECEVSIR